MQVGANQSYLLGLFNTTNTDSNGIISMDLSSLLSPSTAAAAANGGNGTPPAPVAPTPPWSSTEPDATAKANIQAALAGQPIINESAAQLDLPGASTDYKKLFALYKGLDTLENMATQAAANNMSPEDLKQLSKAFQSGLTQVSDYVDSSSFEKLRLADGDDSASTQTTLSTQSRPAATYVTPPLTNSVTADIPALDGPAQFNIAVTLNKKTTNIPIDLSNMGSQTHSLMNVTNYINDQLKAAGVQTRVATSRIPGAPQTITAGGQTITLPATSDQYALQVNIGTSETVNFSAPQTAGAVYVAQTVGNPDPDSDPSTDDSAARGQITKFQTDTNNVAAPPQISSQANFTDGRVFSTNLDPNVGTVHATTVGPDGSVYMLADVTDTVKGQTIQGEQDVALMKYDSAGHLIYTRTMGASDSATGLGLAVSSTGQVAVVGSVTGGLNGATNGALNSTGAFAGESDSFVSLYDAAGNEVWTARRGASQTDQASQVAFSADGKTVYVAGQAQGTLPASTPIGGQDGYIEAFQTTTAGAPKATFTQTFGTTGSDSTKGMVVDGNTMITASVENGHGVLRNYDISSGTPVLSNTRDLGDLQGGTIAGLSLNNGQVVVAGTTGNPALSAGTITRAASGGTDAFAAQMSEDLNPASTDALAYYGGSGNDRATALSVSGGQVWIGGQAGGDLPGQPQVGTNTKDGFIAQLDIGTGQIVTSDRFTGAGGQTVVNSIAVDATGSSILDRLGLPKGNIGVDTSQQLTGQSSLRAGDQFTIGTGNSPPTTITIDANETMQTLAQKISRATGFEANVTVSSGTQKINIAPAYAQVTLTIGAGPAGKDALPTLGLTEGMLSQTMEDKDGNEVPADGGSNIYGLGLSSTLNIDSADEIKHAQAMISAAMGVVRRAYQDLVTAATPKTAATTAAQNGKTGTVPTYLTNQLANLQAGLARLTGGSSASTGTTLSTLV